VRDRIEMADPRDPGSKQPYHAVEGCPIGEAERRLAGYAASAGRMAHDAIRRITERLAGEGHGVVGLGILQAAGRTGGNLADTLASHALIHTADGNHFRAALAEAAARCRLPTSRVRAPGLEAEAATAIGRAPQALQRTVKDLGREIGAPWGADQKAAALLAWMVLAQASAARRGTAR
jgi:hypothetical protein